ncbi:P-loop containing nucleoside triphosphate hydrolase protein [Microdochium trichocladiopsis]|uniref:ATP-dependent RNA helicase n=1 Tax=Microdochium trichocladiopsis TaxID=1682393 RepID=A0A9P8Y179_9PEZI|nr:P-loop containing nucleoside triphosphate hydrolase protein [Microdochium trichocladiopsis]KAH7028018.1 P-loop containing nucleoside triphosphate hydrolase protein [Microdochium trichocladiopsis]
MAPSVQSNKKRKVAPNGSAAPDKKRKTQATSSKAAAKKKARRPVSVDSLRWRKATLPDMTNDAEGFFGLEEIDDVEVIRHENNTVEFRALESATAKDDDKPDSSKKTGKGQPKTEEHERGDAVDGSDDDEFEGFDDEPSQAPIPSPDPPAQGDAEDETSAAGEEEGQDPKGGDSIDAEISKPLKKKEKKKKKVAVETEEDLALESNVFNALVDTAEEPEEEVDVTDWKGLGLSPQILAALSKLKFSKPTQIQAAVVPHILAGNDVIGKASTGSGKTLAFGIPIVEKWLQMKSEQEETTEPAEKEEEIEGESTIKSPLALILSPTRELAHQLTEHIKNLCAGLPTSPYVCSVTGGLSVQKQQRQLVKADIVIGTPGRLWEVLSSSSDLMQSFRGIGYLVVDEADRLLTEGHFKEASEILSALDRVEVEEDGEESEPSPRQTLVFSATFHKGLQQKLAGKGRFNLMTEQDSMEYLLKKLNFREEKPKFIDVNPVSQMAEGLKEGLVECGAMEKDLYLYALLLFYPTARTLVFTNSISSARRITPMLQNLNLSAFALHSQMPQKARLRSIERFTVAPKGKSSILIATDVAARGLDIPGVDLVVHYHVPRAADTYVHRSGRTARAQQTGLSILLSAPEEVTPTRRLIAKVHSQRDGGSSKPSRKNFFVQSVEMDRKLVGRLKPRLTLAKKIADAQLAKEKGNKEDDWMRNAAEELGVEYDSDEIENVGKWGGRGSGRQKKAEEARGLTKAELAALRAELRELLSKRVNTGVSEKYIATGMVDVDELLRGAQGDFLGRVEGLDIASL